MTRLIGTHESGSAQRPHSASNTHSVTIDSNAQTRGMSTPVSVASSSTVLSKSAAATQSRLASIQKNDFATPVASDILKWTKDPSTFWINGRSVRCPTAKSIVSLLYSISRHRDKSVMLKAFAHIAIFLVAERIREHLGFRNFHAKVAALLVDFIFEITPSPEKLVRAKKDQHSDYQSGKEWHGFAQAGGGYGMLFYLPFSDMRM